MCKYSESRRQSKTKSEKFLFSLLRRILYSLRSGICNLIYKVKNVSSNLLVVMFTEDDIRSMPLNKLIMRKCTNGMEISAFLNLFKRLEKKRMRMSNLSPNWME